MLANKVPPSFKLDSFGIFLIMLRRGVVDTLPRQRPSYHMPPTPTLTAAALRSIFKPIWVRVTAAFASVIAAIAMWDATSNQFGLPKLPTLFMTVSALMPLWGWLMLFQTVIVAAALDAIRRQRPSPSVLQTDARIDEMAEKQARIIDDYQRMCGQEARFEESLEKLEKRLRFALAERDKTLDSLSERLPTLTKIEEKLEMVRVDGAINTRDIGKLGDLVEKNSQRVVQSFLALQNREMLRGLEGEISSVADTLYVQLRDGKTYSDNDWRDWVGIQTYWEANLRQWINIAQWYAPDVERRVMTIADSEYGSAWTVKDAQIPTAEGTRQFRRFRILLAHWEAIRPQVKDGVNHVAFVGLSEVEVQRRPANFA
ncbi:hypothetical protein [Sphingomonas sanguinis]|uniref:Uncharacterized protein n=1 Tax=Sphingomonas sanguinis TaxID=33051 RepID=A0A147IT86_9SPHN|nr:hypothetical protein [Sphingomonas sanguinis]KTT98685.1 hypothetical protein SB4_10565 [Sphingomonas sanguinis]